MLTLLITLAIVGFALWLFNQFVPMDPRFKTAINGLVCLLAFLYVIGVLTGHGPVLKL
jgi:hypothetical protein